MVRMLLSEPGPWRDRLLAKRRAETQNSGRPGRDPRPELCPIAIPETSLSRYISFFQALNLRYRDENTGDWHFRDSFYQYAGDGRSALVAGEGCDVNTNQALGPRGVREMAEIVEAQNIRANIGPVYVANHYRAIVDLVVLELDKRRVPMIAGNSTINQWLDTEAQIQELRDAYLLSVRMQLDDDAREVFDQWIPTVCFD